MSAEAKYRILVVDDDSDVRNTIVECLSDRYEMVTARDGRDALEKLDQLEPDFIILDIKMPQMDGFETCTAIRKKNTYQYTPVLFLSGYNSRENITQSYGTGGTLFLPKPIDSERLRKNIDIFFQQSPPSLRPKKMTLHQLQIISKTDATTHSATAQIAASSPELSESLVASKPVAGAMTSPVLPRILIVEDDPDLRDMVQLQLMDEYEVVGAVDGMDGLAKATTYTPDLFIVDVMMPKLNGYQFCQTLRANPYFANTPIIIVTAKQSAKENELAARMGANAFLTKPFDMTRLVQLCQGFTRRPEFHIRPKAVVIELPKPEPLPVPEEPGSRAFQREEAQSRKQRFDF
ncbi:TPA: hypothetical protein DDW35_05635 [Candidatus Sumerlaeota bacterium]|nr:hypothetical protein [Candidatus Sumerlaeota bacterium]